jgi:hypothetical protein
MELKRLYMVHKELTCQTLVQAANVRPALVNTTRLIPSTFTTSTPTRVPHAVATLRRLHALWAVLVQLD